MRRIASHYILGQKAYKIHFIELDERGFVKAISPLTEEIAGTAFFDGLIIPVSQSRQKQWENLWKEIQKENPIDYPSLFQTINRIELPLFSREESVRLFQIRMNPLTASELCTDHSRSNCHI